MFYYTFTSDEAFDLYGGRICRATAFSAGYDLRYVGPSTYYMLRRQIDAIPLGVRVIVDCPGAILLSRSSFPLNYGLVPANGAGLIDADYVDELKFIVYAPQVDYIGMSRAHRQERFNKIEPGDRICQIIPLERPFPEAEYIPPEEFDRLAERRAAAGGRSGGFGSTGLR